MKSPAPAPAVANRGWITVSIMLATFMQGVDTTIANVALPHMQGSMSASQDQIAWVVTSYIVAAAIMTPLTGWLAGRFGIKYVFLVSVLGFTASSALCGAAPSLAQLVFYRLLQGLCGAALVPLSQAVLLQINPPERHARAMAVWGMGVILGPIIGTALGGWLTDNYSWCSVFYINVPFGILSALGLLVFIRESRHGRREAFDWFGFAALSVAIGALQMLLDRDLGRGDRRWAGLLSVRRAHRDRHRPVVPEPRADARRQLHGRHAADVHHRDPALRHDDIAADDAPGFAELSGGYDRSGDGAARDRNDGCDDPRRPPRQPHRHPADHPWRADGDRSRNVADDRFLAVYGHGTGRRDRGIARFRPRLCVHAAEHHHLLDPAPTHVDPGHRDLQPDAQHRRQRRHLDRRGAAGAEHPNRALATR